MRVKRNRYCVWAWSCALLALGLSTFSSVRLSGQENAEMGQENPIEAEPQAGSDPSLPASSILADEQSRVADKYGRLEDLIFKMADFEATSNPRRAALLQQAYKQSKDRLTQSQLNSIVQLLSDQQYKRALDGQEVVRKDLQELLRLLLSEDRSDRLKTETEKVKEYIKELKRLQRIQRSVRGRTEGASDPRDVAKDQGNVADRTADLAEQLEEAESKNEQDSAGQSDDEPAQSSDPSTEGDRDPGDPQDSEQDPQSSPDSDERKEPADSPDPQSPGEAEQAEQEPSQQGAQETQPGQTPPGQQGKDQPQPAESPPGEPGQPQDQPPADGEAGPAAPQDENPARQRVREAEQKMREAQQRLEQAQRDESVEKQTEALEKLQEAIAQLEEVLRQLREEEMQRVLALLEGRFRKMLEMEMKVHEGTVRIDKIPADKRGRAVDIRSSKLAFDQRKIGADADRALTLLLEEGSSVAFPEIVEQLRDDMEEVSARLDQTKVEQITQGLQEEIISTLEELIAALQKAQQEMEEGRPNQPGEPGEGGDPPLVDILAELKMIRSLQLRVKVRTDRYSRLLDDPEDPVGQAMQDELRSALGKLSELQSRIQHITRDIVLGKNR